MSSDLKDELAKAGLTTAVAKTAATPCYIQQVFDTYKRSMSGLVITSPLPETITLRDENFPYWIKLQWHNPIAKSWQDASPAKVLPFLLAGTFDEKGYRLEDPRRARVLPHLPKLLRDPDAIYENAGFIRGKHIYAREHKGQLKVALTVTDPRLKTVIVVSSFKTSKRWLAKHAKRPVYPKGKATS